MVDPCPFCGSENVDPKGWLANDGRSGPACDDCGATAESVEGWNRRAQPEPPAADERADALYDSAYCAGVQEGFRLGDAGDNEGLRKVLESRAGYVAVLRAARASSPNAAGAEGETAASEEFRQIALTELYEFQELTGCSTSDEYREKLAAQAAEPVAIVSDDVEVLSSAPWARSGMRAA
ncbi:Lar family restriction alleviation protein [Burkholderia thailandensis]|uniref:Lar family restriction alleviation protein n=1 Tax=Burkholderia thailandensis TaxID=57975 RepID=UPI00016A28AA|nr:Lar family restriction alleviation protein [Burkholderia thailandensis]AIP62708.1 hypothetical protein DR62_2500 [Burkholderia thailandensis]AOI52256.1 hypothetical protein WI24_10900 [Burkholderia thailandensis]